QTMAKVIAILNPKGGSGKTTLTLNLARALQKRGNRVLIMDSDPQGTAREWRQRGEEGQEQPTLVAVDRPIIDKEVPGLSHAFDVIMIDGAAKLEQMGVSALKVADLVLIPVRPSGPDIWAAASLIELIQTRQQITGGQPAASWVITQQKQGTRLADDVERTLAEFNLPVLPHRISDRVAFVETMTRGATVMEGNDAKAKKEINHITNDISALFGDQL
ncbi:MAG: AAA family ATPase, partial [Magnetococcales bacterium]|nr:AAA family ATPase [Magnetococcales bacterium]